MPRITGHELGHGRVGSATEGERAIPRITSHKLSHGPYDYEIEIGFDDGALMENLLKLKVTARRIDPQTGHKLDVPAEIEVDLPNMVARITVGGIDIGEVDLVDLELPEGLAGEEAWERLLGFMGRAGSIDEAIQQFVPVPDPVLGCLLKAGLTATLGQTITCYDKVKGSAGVLGRARRLFVCVAENGWGILRTATGRTLRCWAMLGFG